MSFLFNKLARYYDGFMTMTGLSNENILLGFMGDVKNLRIGDIGGGTGTLAAILSALEADVTIIDPSMSMTEIAVGKCPDIKVLNAAAENIPIENGYFDMVCIRDCLHHIHCQEEALREAVRILKPGGSVVIQEFKPDTPAAILINILERLYGEKSRFIQPEKLKNMMLSNSVEGQIHWIRSFEYVFAGCKIGQA